MQKQESREHTEEFVTHWRALEHMYSLAPCNTVHKHVCHIPNYGLAEVTSPILPELFHGGDAMHG